MGISVSKKRSRLPKVEPQEVNYFGSIVPMFVYRIPPTLFILFLIFLWSSSTTIISGNSVHVCVSSRNLSYHYSLSAGANSSSETPASPVNGSSSCVGAHHLKYIIRKVASFVLENPLFTINFKNSIQKDKGEKFTNAVKDVEEQLKTHRSWISTNTSQTTCDGIGIYVYDLPPKFNKDLVGQCGDMLPWADLCQYFTNDALGQPIPNLGKCWYQTHQYSLELIFHSRVLKHPCRVYNESEAKLFYVPFYGGLDILRWHFKNVSNDVRDALALDLVKWLESQTPWVRNSGKDHVFVLGKISWDFRRNPNSSWGTSFLKLDQMQNPVKVLIERQPWEVNDIGIPHPTHFHPRTDEDVITWQLQIMRSDRKSLVSFAGAARPGSTDNIRSTLINQCTSAAAEKCTFLNCSSGGCEQPASLIGLFMESEFCLQPPGDSPTRKSVFDSLVSGCMPVLFDPFTAYYQYPWHLPEDHGKYSVFIAKEDVREMKVNVVERLMKFSMKERDDMRRYIVYELLPGLVYGDPSAKLDKFQDAFSITINNLLERASRLG
ncbi:hypothetical protein RJ639_033819 [Escallonia herrerae]|uniref:Exostosin GT47 domain-containing protein n=1 Tax=Escallonia herrerae TaxID=1293975 RepID=A0AA89BBN4_9ASTE|nr:hypothetical protein RJ639_033819 [Escallonia herrerae]